MNLNDKLSIENQRYLLGNLFGFDVDENEVIYDEDGDEFYGNAKSFEYDLSTLIGIIQYSNFLAFERGRVSIREAIKKELGL